MSTIISGSSGFTFPNGTTQTTAAVTPTAVANLSGGAASQIPYQTAPGVTAFVANGTEGQVLMSNGAAAPSWGTPSSFNYASMLKFS